MVEGSQPCASRQAYMARRSRYRSERGSADCVLEMERTRHAGGKLNISLGRSSSIITSMEITSSRLVVVRVHKLFHTCRKSRLLDE